jgi:hypothetical protein
VRKAILEFYGPCISASLPLLCTATVVAIDMLSRSSPCHRVAGGGDEVSQDDFVRGSGMSPASIERKGIKRETGRSWVFLTTWRLSPQAACPSK